MTSYGSIAQLGEHLPYKQRVIGSSPIVPTIIVTALCGNGSVVERRLAKANVASSNLVSRSIFLLWGFSHKVMLTAPSPSGKARVCKTLTPSSNLGGASSKTSQKIVRFLI